MAVPCFLIGSSYACRKASFAACSSLRALWMASVLIRRRLAVSSSFAGLGVSYGFARTSLMSKKEVAALVVE